MANWHVFLMQGRRKQSADGQAQLNAGGEDTIILRSRSAQQFLAVRRRSHYTSTSNWELPLLDSPALQETLSLIKS